MTEPIVVAALYKFVQLADYEALRQPLAAAMCRLKVRGTVLLAKEGVNGTISAPRGPMDEFLGLLKNDPRLADLEHKESLFSANPFYRGKVRLKHEIVTLGVAGIDPSQRTGTHVEPEDWNALISDPDVVLIDARNEYEVELGTFQGARDPRTKSFGELPDYVARELDPKRHTRVAMFCTGGIRCEKASSFMLSQGFEQVFQLKGGILKYLERIPQQDSKWHGSCFVFDQRVSLLHGLEPSGAEICHGCRAPLRPDDKHSSHYEEGVTCPRCHNTHTGRALASARERQKQVKLAKQRGMPKPFGNLNIVPSNGSI